MDEESLKEQVMVAAFPDQLPEVHVGSFDASEKSIVLKEATVLASGQVSIGKQVTVDLSKAERVESKEGMMAILGPQGAIVVQLHIDTPEDLKVWTSAVKSVIGGPNPATSGAPPMANGSTSSPAYEAQEGEDEVNFLRARSQQLQNRVGELEGISKKTDQALNQMMNRLDGSMEMLAAVHDMCSQQKRVIEAQKIAIAELTNEVQASVAAKKESHAKKAGAPPATTVDEESAGKVEEMMMLLQKADEMQRALQELQAAHAEAEESPQQQQQQQQQQQPQRRAVPTPKQSTAAAATRATDDDDESAEAQTQELRALEAEKARFEGLLANSQGEHADLLSRLNSMRSMMTALGINMDDLNLDEMDDDDDDEEEE
mmetsp:Transcript_89215/g.195545  ORF Transcript_89215/g.195545 Transcript_89215/m.195545 type:complete len:373 (+) Transcript_89215:64-1182(+)